MGRTDLEPARERRLGSSRPGPGASGALPLGLAAALVFFAGGAVLIIEVVALRLVAPYVGVTLQTSSAVIGVALAAIAVGAWSGGRLADLREPRRLLPITLVLAGIATAGVLPLVRLAGPILQSDDPVSVTLLAFITVFTPCVFLAAVTPMVVKLQLRDLARTGTMVGRLSGLGTLGAIVATFVTGFVLLALFPTSAIVVGLGLATFLLGLGLGFTPGAWRRPPPALFALAVLAVGLLPLLPSPCAVETAYHCARVVHDPARPSGRVLVLDTLLHSYVDLADPTYLQFPYVQAIASVADVMRPPGQPLSALHLGAGGLTVPRYLAATRPGSASRVLEVDARVIALDRAQLGLQPAASLQIDIRDARVGLAEEVDGARDVVVGDAFGGIAVPWHLTTRELAADIRRVLRPDGIYAVNVIDHPPNRFIQAEVTTIGSVFPNLAIVAPEGALANRSGGNFVIVASGAALPLTALRRRLQERGTPVVVSSGGDAARFGDGAQILTDDQAPVDQLLTPHAR